MTISQQQADDWLSAGLVPYEEAVLGALKREPTQEQFDAMVSLCWNIGPGNFRSSTVVREFNKGNTQAAADAFLKWNRANGKVMKGLTNRRKDERSVFLDA
jgi:lysozyme